MAIGASAVGTLAYAYTETVETMTVELNDGTNVQYKIENVARVSFEAHEETVGCLISDGTGAELYKTQEIEPVFRLVPEDDALPTHFLFGSADNVEELADLKNGKYMAHLEISNAALFQPDIDLAGENSGVILKLYEWTDGEISATHETLAEGTITTARNARGIFTLELDAKFADGLAVRASYRGLPTDVSDLEVLFPTPGPKNEANYYNADGALSQSAKIVGFKKSEATSGPMKGAAVYTAIFDEDHSDIKCEIHLDPSWVGKAIDFATIEKSSKPVCYFRYGSIQIYSNNDYAGMSGTKGTVEVIENEDGTLTVNADVTNQYLNWGMSGGTPERATVEYTGECEGLEVAAKNTVEYYNQDGTLMRTAAIEGFTKKVSGNGNVKYTATLGGDEADTKCEIEMIPALLGQVINFADFTEVPDGGAPQFNFRFDNIQLSGPNSQWRNQGLEGTIQVVENGDGTITVTANVVNKYIPGGSTTPGGSPERVIIDYKGACSGL